MPTDTERLIFLLEANTKKFEAALLKAEKQADRRMALIEKRANTMEARLAASMEKGGKSLMNAIGSTALLAVLAKTGSTLADLSDAYTSAHNQAKLYSTSQEEATAKTEMLMNMAIKTRAKFEDLTQVYAGVNRAAQSMGMQASQINAVTEAVGTAVQIANTGPTGVSGALLQLSQMLPAAKVSAEEFNSVFEQTPRLAQAIADGIERTGGSMSKLQSMVKNGEVSGSEVIKALISQLPKLREEFAGMEPTISSAFETLRTGAIQAVSRLNDTTNASKVTAEFIRDLGNNMDLAAAALIIFVTEAAKLAKVAVTAAGVAAAVYAIAQAWKWYIGITAAIPALTLAEGLSLVGASAMGATTGIRALGTAALGFIRTPMGIVILAVAAALAYLITKTVTQIDAQQKLQEQSNRVHTAMGEYEVAVMAAANATGDAVKPAQELAKAKHELAVKTVEATNAELRDLQVRAASAKAKLAEAQALQSAAASRMRSESQYGGSSRFEGSGAIRYGMAAGDAEKAASEYAKIQEQVKAQELVVKEAEVALKRIEGIEKNGGLKFNTTPPPGKDKKGRGSGESEANKAAAAQRKLYEETTKLLEWDLKLKQLRGEETNELERQIEIRKLAVEISSKGAPTAEDEATATAKINEYYVAKVAEIQKAINARHKELELSIAQTEQDWETVRAKQKELEFEEMVKNYRDMGLTIAQAETQARIDQNRLIEARAAETERQLLAETNALEIERLKAAGLYDQAQALEDEIALEDLRNKLAEMGVENYEEMAQKMRDVAISTRNQTIELQKQADELDRQIDILDRLGKTRERDAAQKEKDKKARADELAQKYGMSPDKAKQQAEQEQLERDRATIEGEIRTTFKGALLAAVKGDDWKQVLQDKLSEAFDNAINSLADILMDVIKGAFSRGGTTSGSWGGIMDGVSAIFGKRAEGGNMKAGRTYLVGERGPEPFTPGVSGAIAANKNLKGLGGGPSRVNIHIDARDAVLTSQLRQDMIQAVKIGVDLKSAQDKADSAFNSRYRV